MMSSDKEVSDLKLKVGLIEKDVEIVDRSVDKITLSIEKIQELNNNIFRMITLHESKHDEHEKKEINLQRDIKDLHERIDVLEAHISSRIDDLRSDLLLHKKSDKLSVQTLIQEVEKWKWMILGGILVGGFLLGKLDILANLFSIVK
jgi:chromosome segregation ATPase